MSKGRGPTASLRGSPSCIRASEEASGESHSAPFPTSAAVELLESFAAKYRGIIVRLTGQLKGVERALLEAESKLSATEEALLALKEQPKSGNDQAQ